MLCWETLFVQLPNHRAANDSVYQKRFSFCPISRWSSTCWWIFRCSSAVVWGGCTDTGHFWSPGLPEKFIWFLSMTSNLAGCTLLHGCFVEWTYAQFTKCCSPKKMASSILTEASLPAQISGLWHQVVMLYICTPVWVEQCLSFLFSGLVFSKEQAELFCPSLPPASSPPSSPPPSAYSPPCSLLG